MKIDVRSPRAADATPAALPAPKSQSVRPEQRDAVDTFDAKGTVSLPASDAEVRELLEKFGFETKKKRSLAERVGGAVNSFISGLRSRLGKLFGKFGVTPADAPEVGKRVATNLRALIAGLNERQAKIVKYVVNVFGAIGLAVTKAATFNDLKQLKEFLKMAMAAGKPMEILGPIVDVATFVLSYPEETRKILKFLNTTNRDTWTQKSPWMAAGLKSIGAKAMGPAQQADVVVIGGGLSAAAIVKQFSHAFKSGEAKAIDVLVLERDSKEKREHQASLRNAGIICTACDYVFSVDEAIGEEPVLRIQKALAINREEAEHAYESLMQVMAGATARITGLLKDKKVDIGLEEHGSFDVATTRKELAHFRLAAAKAREVGLDWDVVDQAFLAEHHGIESKHVAGALFFKDSGQLHPGKLVEALFSAARAESKKINVQWDTELGHAERTAEGKWRLHTSQGAIDATHVIDAREAFAPYEWREKRYSQIHVLDVPKGSAPMQLGETSVCHGLSYMRRLDDGKFLLGSGDFPLSNADGPPPPLGSVALYAAAHFKKLFPDTPFDIAKVWGGVFGHSSDGLPVAGELVDGWHVVGGAGGSGMNLCPAMAEQTVAGILKLAGEPLAPGEAFSPRRFFLKELRHDLARLLARVPGESKLRAENIRVELIAPGESERAQVIDGDAVFYVEEKTLDAMNTDVAVLFGPSSVEELRAREQLKGQWLTKQLELAHAGLLFSSARSPATQKAPGQAPSVAA